MTHFQPHIPGETPIDDISDLKIKGITTRAELNEFEATNISKVVQKYLSGRPSKRSAPFNYAWCLKLHKEMFGDVWAWAGLQRDRDVNIGVASWAIPENLALLLEDLHHWRDYDIELVEQAARLHHRAVQIHPFVNGNGRWSRMLANIWLKLHDQPVTLWPEVMIGSASEVRSRYLATVQRADGGEYDYLIAMHREFMDPKQP